MTPLEKEMRAQREVLRDDEATHEVLRVIENRLFWTAVKAVVVGYSVVGVFGGLGRLAALWWLR